MNGFKTFFYHMLSDSGTVSFARAITMVIVFFVLGWDSSFVIHTHDIPPGAELLGQAAFMSVFYGLNKAGAALQGKSEDPEPSTNPTPA